MNLLLKLKKISITFRTIFSRKTNALSLPKIKGVKSLCSKSSVDLKNTRKIQNMNSCKLSPVFLQIRKQVLKFGNSSQASEMNCNPVMYQIRDYTTPSGTPGSGAGKGGGAGGSIKESGGGLGKYGAAQEEGYFYHKDKEQLGKIKQKIKSEPEKEKEPTQKPEE